MEIYYTQNYLYLDALKLTCIIYNIIINQRLTNIHICQFLHHYMKNSKFYQKCRVSMFSKINMNLIFLLEVIVSTKHHRNELYRITFLFGLILTYTLSAIPAVREESVNGAC